MQGARYITDRFEWESLVLTLGTDAFHHPSWALTSARRVGSLARRPCEASYLRVWSDDSLIAVPVIRLRGRRDLTDEVFNAPRCSPVVLTGSPMEPDQIVDVIESEVVDDFTLHDDSKQRRMIAEIHEMLTEAAARSRSFSTIAPSDIAEMVATVHWDTPEDYHVWREGISAADRASWDLTFWRHLDARGNPIGWSATATVGARRETEVVVFAVVAGEHAHPWTSQR